MMRSLERLTGALLVILLGVAACNDTPLLDLDAEAPTADTSIDNKMRDGPADHLAVSDGQADAPRSDGSPDDAPSDTQPISDLRRDAGSPPADQTPPRPDQQSPDITAPPLGVACTKAGYGGWRCLDGRQHSAAHGVGFGYQARWNLSAGIPRATVLWVVGGDGTQPFRSGYNGAGIQNRLESTDGMRSVEIAFTDVGGYWRLPKRGYPDTARVLVDIIDTLKTKGVIAGQWVSYVGGSNATTLAAAGLARHGLASRVKRFIFGAGPFGFDLAVECVDTTHVSFMRDDIRRLMDDWNGWGPKGTDQRYCEKKTSTAAYGSRSLLGTGARVSYGPISIAIIMGDTDGFGPWINISNHQWYRRVQMGASVRHLKTRYLLDEVGHDTFGVSGQQPSVGQAHSLDLVYRHARAAPSQVVDPKPKLIFSTTKNGPPVTQFALSGPLYGRVENCGAKARGCTEAQGREGLCDTLAGWSTMPNGDWTYTASEGWRLEFANIGTSGFPAGRYDMFWRDDADQQHSDVVRITIQ